MQISNNLEDLKKENALLIITSVHVARVHQLKKGKVSKKPTIDIQRPQLTDREGTRRRPGKGTVWGTASDYQQHDNNVRVEFLNNLKKELKEILQAQPQIEALYIFSPSSIIKEIREIVPKTHQKKIALEYTGNFIKFTAEELLEKVEAKKDSERKRKEKLKPATAKILNRKKQKNNKK
jgi:hypothetical protein